MIGEGSGEYVSLAETAERLGFSVAHVRRLVASAQLTLAADGESISLCSIEELEKRRRRGRASADEFSRALDRAGAPPE